MSRGCRWVRLPRSWNKDIGRSLSNFRFSSFSSARASDTSAQPVKRFRPGGGECQALWNLTGDPIASEIGWGHEPGLDARGGLTLSGRPLQVPDDVEVSGALRTEGQQNQLQESREHCESQKQWPQGSCAQHRVQAQHLQEKTGKRKSDFDVLPGQIWTSTPTPPS